MRHLSVQPRLLWALLSLLWFNQEAVAEEITLTCTIPTQNTDGSTLTDLAGIRFYESPVAGGPYTQVAQEATCSTVIDRPAGTYYFTSKAYNTAGVESDYSNEATKTITTQPAPPTGLTVTGSLFAHGLSQSKNVLSTYIVGRVPLGTACDGSTRLNNMYRVSFEAVAWIGTARPLVVFAECG